MFKLFWNRVTAKVKAQPDWRHDPLGHPAIREMNLRELADLPVVAEVPMRVNTAEVAAGCRKGLSQELSSPCAGS
jgi:hypothetical protein